MTLGINRAEKVSPNLSRFIQSYQKAMQAQKNKLSRVFRPTQVAIIDNGILSIPPQPPGAQPRFPISVQSSRDEENLEPSLRQPYRTLWSRIRDGCSFVTYDDRVSP